MDTGDPEAAKALIEMPRYQCHKQVWALKIGKNACGELEFLTLTLPNGRALSLALTKLEEFYMWVGKAIRDDQIARNGSAPAQEERKNG